MKFFKKKKSDRNLSTSVQELKPSKSTIDSPAASSTIKKKPLPNDNNVTKISTPQARTVKTDEIVNTIVPPVLMMPKPRRILTPTRAILGRFDYDKTQVEEEDAVPENKNDIGIMTQGTIVQEEISPILLPTAREDLILPQLVKTTTRFPQHATVSSLSTIFSDDSSTSRVYMSACESVTNSIDESTSIDLPDIDLSENHSSAQTNPQKTVQDPEDTAISNHANTLSKLDSPLKNEQPNQHTTVITAVQSSTSSATATPVLHQQQPQIEKVEKLKLVKPKPTRPTQHHKSNSNILPSEAQNQTLVFEANSKEQRQQNQEMIDKQRQQKEHQELIQRQMLEEQRQQKEHQELMQRQILEEQRLRQEQEELQRKLMEKRQKEQELMQRQYMENQRLQREQQEHLQQLEEQRLQEKDKSHEAILKELKQQIKMMEEQRIKDKEEWDRKEQELMSHRNQIIEALLETKDQINSVIKQRDESKKAYQQQLKKQQFHQLQQKITEMAISIEQLPEQSYRNVAEDEHAGTNESSENIDAYDQAPPQQQYNSQYGYDADNIMQPEDTFDNSPKKRVNKSRSEEHIRYNTRSSSRSSQRYIYPDELPTANQLYMGYNEGYLRNSRKNSMNAEDNRKSTISRQSSNASNLSGNPRPSISTPNPRQYSKRRPRARSIETARWYDEQRRVMNDSGYADETYQQKGYDKPRRSRSAGRDARRPSSRNSMSYNNGYFSSEDIGNGMYDHAYEDVYYDSYVDSISPSRVRYNPEMHYHHLQYGPPYAPPNNGYYYHPSQQQHYRPNMRYDQSRHHFSYS